MKGKIYVKTINSFGNEITRGEVVEIVSSERTAKMVICNKENSKFFVIEPNYCIRIKSLDDPTPYYEKKKSGQLK